MQPIKPSILCTGAIDLSLLTRSERDAADIDVVQFTEVTSFMDQQLSDEILNLINKKATVVFTSSNALAAVATLVVNQRPDWQVYCLGNTTYEMARSIFGSQMDRQTATNAASLARQIISNHAISEVVFFCGNLRRNDLPDLLRDNNITIKETVVYHTRLAPQKINKEYDAVLFFSPSAAESFFSLNLLPLKTTTFVIGHTTAGKARDYTQRVVISEIPDKLYLLSKAIKSLVSSTA